jgi:hypothetical protein
LGGAAAPPYQNLVGQSCCFARFSGHARSAQDKKNISHQATFRYEFRHG